MNKTSWSLSVKISIIQAKYTVLDWTALVQPLCCVPLSLPVLTKRKWRAMCVKTFVQIKVNSLVLLSVGIILNFNISEKLNPGTLAANM